MIRRIVRSHKGIELNQSYEAEPLEVTMRRNVLTAEPIQSTAPQIFTERKEGVRPEYDIRTDRMEVAREAMDAVSKASIAKREKNFKTEQKQAETPSGTSDSN